MRNPKTRDMEFDRLSYTLVSHGCAARPAIALKLEVQARQGCGSPAAVADRGSWRPSRRRAQLLGLAEKAPSTKHSENEHRDAKKL